MTKPTLKYETVVLPSSVMPIVLRKHLEHPWHWFVVAEGRLLSAGSEVCSSICWELAARAIIDAEKDDLQRRLIEAESYKGEA
jgi:hypothetical protein